MHLYYEYPNSSSALAASAAVYDLNAPPRNQRTTLYSYSVCPHTGSTDPRCLVMYTDDQYFDTGSVFNGVPTLTNQQAIEQGYFVSGSPAYDDEGLH